MVELVSAAVVRQFEDARYAACLKREREEIKEGLVECQGIVVF